MVEATEITKMTYGLMTREELIAECVSLYEVNLSLKSTIAERDQQVAALSYYIKIQQRRVEDATDDGQAR